MRSNSGGDPILLITGISALQTESVYCTVCSCGTGALVAADPAPTRGQSMPPRGGSQNDEPPTPTSGLRIRIRANRRSSRPAGAFPSLPPCLRSQPGSTLCSPNRLRAN